MTLLDKMRAIAAKQKEKKLYPETSDNGFYNSNKNIPDIANQSDINNIEKADLEAKNLHRTLLLVT